MCPNRRAEAQATLAPRINFGNIPEMLLKFLP
jgi:hypothetical protein